MVLAISLDCKGMEVTIYGTGCLILVPVPYRNRPNGTQYHENGFFGGGTIAYRDLSNAIQYQFTEKVSRLCFCGVLCARFCIKFCFVLLLCFFFQCVNVPVSQWECVNGTGTHECENMFE